MPNTPDPAAATGLPTSILHDIHDCLLLALDATERTSYTRAEREARSYMRSALKDTRRLMGEVKP